jgi:hypothetical protein
MLLSVRVSRQGVLGDLDTSYETTFFCSFAKRFSSRFLLIGFLGSI